MGEVFRWLVIKVLALFHGLNLKEVGARASIPQKEVSRLLRQETLKDEDYETLVSAVARRPVEAEIVAACIDDLRSLREVEDLSDEEQIEVERGVRESSRELRKALVESARQSRMLPALDAYPRQEDAETLRWHAELLWSLLKDMTENEQLAVVREVAACRSWALMERVCAESVAQASRNLERASFLAGLAREIAGRVQGPEGWCRRVQGYAAAHLPNVLRVAGELKAAREALEVAKTLWTSGSDPEEILDPGRILDLEASLCRAERRFQEARALLDQALPVSHSPGRILINRGCTLQVMGDDDSAVESLVEAQRYVHRETDPQLWYKLISNLAGTYCRLGRCAEASVLVEQARPVAEELGDEIDLCRLRWLEGRLAASQGRLEEARRSLEEARRGLADRDLWYDVALARLEEAALHLEEGRTREVQVTAEELLKAFEQRGVHREALAAVRLFFEAAARETATVRLVRSIVSFLERSRYDQGLRYSDSGTLGTAVGVEPAASVGLWQGSGPAGAVGIEPASLFGPRSGAAKAVGVEDASLGLDGEEEVLELGDQIAPAGSGGPEGEDEGEGGHDDAHVTVSCAAPSADLPGPRGPRLAGMVRHAGAKFPMVCQVAEGLSPRQRLVRLVRALSGKTQKAFGELTQVDPDLIALYEVGKRDPGEDTLRRLVEGADLTGPAAKEVLSYADSLRRPRCRSGWGAAELTERLMSIGTRFRERLLRIEPAGTPPRPEDLLAVADLWRRLRALGEAEQVAVVGVGREYQSWALAVFCCDESVAAASQDIGRAQQFANLAWEMAARIPGPERWRLRVAGFVLAHLANVTRVAGNLQAARAELERAKALWSDGSDPGGLLDPGRLLDLEASLCRAERNLLKAIACLDEAVAVGREKGRLLVNKGATLEVLGEYGRAVEAFLQAGREIDRDSDPRLWYKQRANLAVIYTHTGRYREAEELVREARPVANALGDEIDLVRLTWLEGRIAAGLGRRAEAQGLLEQASEAFTARNMWYDVALAELEIAALCLNAGQLEKVKARAEILKKVFESKGVHREALAALQLFKEAMEREEATAELARRVLDSLFRARFAAKC